MRPQSVRDCMNKCKAGPGFLTSFNANYYYQKSYQQSAICTKHPAFSRKKRVARQIKRHQNISTSVKTWLLKLFPVAMKAAFIRDFFHRKLYISLVLRRQRDQVQLNKYQTDPYFLQIFQSNTSVCLIISVFCKSSNPICEPEITPVLYHLENHNNQFHFQCPVHKSCKTRK